MSAARLAAGALLLAAAGCGDPAPAPPPVPGGDARDDRAARATAAEVSEDEERLRSLPYAGFGARPAADGTSGVVFRASGHRAGYRLVTVQSRSRADLLDPSGAVARSWSIAESDRWERAVPAADGGLLVVGVAPLDDPGAGIPDDARYMAKLDRDGALVWRRSARVHHDVVERADGSLLALTFERREVPSIHPTLDVRDDRVDVFESDGTPRAGAGCSLLEALGRAQDRWPLQGVRPTSLGVVPWIDLFHANSVQWLDAPPPGVGDAGGGPGVLVCSRHQNRVAWIDWDTCRATWSWGAGELSGPHDATFLPGGRLLVFDNGLDARRSRLLEVDPATGAIAWEWTASPPETFFTISKGSVQRLPGGGALVADSDAGRAFEIDGDGAIVWEWLAGDRDAAGRRAAIVRIRDLGLDPPQAAGLR